MNSMKKFFSLIGILLSFFAPNLLFAKSLRELNEETLREGMLTVLVIIIFLIVLFIVVSRMVKNAKHEKELAQQRGRASTKQPPDINNSGEENCIKTLESNGYLIKKKSSDNWVIIEPLGGRVVIRSLEGLEEYTGSIQNY